MRWSAQRPSLRLGRPKGGEERRLSMVGGLRSSGLHGCCCGWRDVGDGALLRWRRVELQPGRTGTRLQPWWSDTSQCTVKRHCSLFMIVSSLLEYSLRMHEFRTRLPWCCASLSPQSFISSTVTPKSAGYHYSSSILPERGATLLSCFALKVLSCVCNIETAPNVVKPHCHHRLPSILRSISTVKCRQMKGTGSLTLSAHRTSFLTRFLLQPVEYAVLLAVSSDSYSLSH